jgi:hypothetical protein
VLFRSEDVSTGSENSDVKTLSPEQIAAVKKLVK